MKREWEVPEIMDLEVKATQYAPEGGTIQDGAYQSNDGKWDIPTYASSAGNSGKPDVEVKP